MKDLSRNEEHILLSIFRLGEDAYGVPIRKDFMSVTGNTLHYGSLYNTLDLLLRKGLIVCRETEPENCRGGRRKKIYKLTNDGVSALKKLQALQRSAWNDIPDLA